jgi:hypothetical protein
MRNRLDVSITVEVEMPDKKWSLFENGMPGLHLTINPQKLPSEAHVYRQFIDHGITLRSDELKTLLADRSKGIAILNNMMRRLLPGFSPNKRLAFSTQIADALFDKSLSAQLARDAPNTLDRLQQRDEVMEQVYRKGPAPTLLQQVPFGVSLTLHF